MISNLSSKLEQSRFAEGYDRRILSVNNSLFLMNLRFLAFVVSFLNICVLMNHKLRKKDSLYRFLLIISIVDALYSATILTLGSFARICYAENPVYCSSSTYHKFLISYIILSEYITTALAFFNVILENFITLQRIIIISNLQFLRRVSVKVVCFVFLLISFIVYTPILWFNKIEKIEIINGTQTLLVDYKLTKTNFSQTTLAKTIVTSLSMTRLVLVTLFLLILNIIAIAKFRAYIKRKSDLTKCCCKFFFFFFLSNLK